MSKNQVFVSLRTLFNGFFKIIGSATLLCPLQYPFFAPEKFVELYHACFNNIVFDF